MSEQERVARGSQIIDGYGDDNSFDRLQGWDYNLSPDARKKIDEQFIIDVWGILDTAGNLLIRKHHDYGPKNIANAPGGPLNGLRVRIFDKISRINHLIDTGATPENESLRDSFMDLANYGIIALMVLDGEWEGING